MSQVKIFGLANVLNTYKISMSEIIHSCIVDSLKYPVDKKFHRFFPLQPDDFYFPKGRTERYTIIEISLFEGRSIEAKKDLIRLLYHRLNEKLGISNLDLEITIFDTPKYNWGIRGVPGDELELNYKVNV